MKNFVSGIFSTMKLVKSGKNVQLHITEYNLTVPKGIGKWQFNIDVTRYVCWVSVINCFIKVRINDYCSYNFFLFLFFLFILNSAFDFQSFIVEGTFKFTNF